MSPFRLLLVEDDHRDLRDFSETVERFHEDENRTIDPVVCATVEDAFSKLDDSFDGAIIDLRIKGDDQAGNRVVDRILEEKIRVPTYILTGTPTSAGDYHNHIRIFTKGEADASFDALLRRLFAIYDTGLTRILGGRGTIESTLDRIFHESLMPHMGQWQTHGSQNPARTEKALLRYILNHMIQIIDDDTDVYLPEEFYLHPPLTDQIRTGSILREKTERRLFVVMTPECDMVLRNGSVRNTDWILLAEVLTASEVFPWTATSCDPSNSQRSQLDSACRNRTGHFHHLPKTDFLEQSFLNFRMLHAISEEQLENDFQLPPEGQISPAFVKDIVARFSSFYARQGQPEIEFASN